MMKKLFLTAAAIVCAALPTHSQSLAGRVSDSMNNPLEYASILILQPADSSLIAGTVSRQDGTFSIALPTPHDGILIKATLLGYKPAVVRPGSVHDSVSITLQPDNRVISETVIKADRPAYRMKNGVLTADVAGSTLSAAGTAKDLLLLMPGVIERDENMEVLGKGTPLLYIDGRKVTDRSEIERLRSTEIKSVAINTRPGARYDASVNAVITITTKNRNDGFGGSLLTTERLAYKPSTTETGELNWRKGNVDLFGSLTYSYSQRYQKQRNRTTVNSGTDQWQLNSDILILPKKATWNATAGFNWQPAAKHSLGLRYTMDCTPNAKSHWPTSQDVLKNGVEQDIIDYDIRINTETGPAHQLNAYYSGQVGKVTLNWNNDFYYSRTNVRQNIEETAESADNRLTKSHDTTHSRMAASRLTAAWAGLEAGYEYTNTDRKDVYVNETGQLPSTDDRIKETNTAVFASYSIKTGSTELGAGLRFEHVESDYYMSGIRVDGQSKTYNNLFPNAYISFPIGKTDVSVSYTSKTKRPQYSALSSNIQYDDRFTYERGNPLLQPETRHEVSVTAMWKWIYASASWYYRKKAIVCVFEPYADDSPISVFENINYSHLTGSQTLLFISPKFGSWSPTLSVIVMTQDFSIMHNGKKKSLCNPLMYVNFNNRIALPHKMTLTAGINCNTSGHSDITNIMPSWRINLSAAKTFGHWFVQIHADDVLKTARNSMINTGSNSIYNKWNYSDSQALRLTVKYSFNTRPSKYKGRQAGAQERNRL